MADYGEWNRKGATLSDTTAKKEYGLSRDFIVKGIRAGKLEYREGTIWGNPYLRVLRSQLERLYSGRAWSKPFGKRQGPDRGTEDQEGNGGVDPETQ